MLLLKEHLTPVQSGIQTLSEGEGKEKTWYLKGIFIQGGVQNLNRRVYPVSEIRKAVDAVRARIESGEPVLGECDHPQELTINLDRVSHMITDMSIEGNAGVGTMKIVDTPHGMIIKTLLDAGAKLGVSSRGSGNVGYDGQVSEFEIVTVDIVAKPSAPDAYPTAVYEAFNGRRGSEIEKLAHAVRLDPSAQKYLRADVMAWIDSLK